VYKHERLLHAGP